MDGASLRELTESKHMKLEHALYAVAGLVGTVLLVERFYRHPTFGRGVQALIAVIRFGEAF